MRAGRLLVPATVFLASLGGTAGVLKLWTPAPGEKEIPNAEPGKSRHREESAFSEIRARLREGDFEGAKVLLRKLGERDPVAFFDLLAKLPGMPGVDGIIRDTAAGLPWNQEEITTLLNRIGPPDWRDLAWGAYTAARIGKVPDEEIFDVGIKARSHVSFSSIRALMTDAAEKRPEAFLEMLNRSGGTSIREEFFDILMKYHPQRAAELFATIPDGSPGSNYDRRYILQARARGWPTTENLAATLEDLGPRGIYSWDHATTLVGHVYGRATPEERGQVLAFIGGQPPLARNRMLAGALYRGEKPLEPAEFAKVVAVYSTPLLQEEALRQWMESQELDPADTSWIEALPGERLRERAKRLLKEGAPRSE
jgi:hypothetical protein